MTISRVATAGLLYGVNTLGAVAGCSIATFFMLERYGTRMTLWIACVIESPGRARRPTNRPARVAVAAPMRATARLRATDAGAIAPAPEWFSLAAAGIVGFAFFLMEMVWYRMLGPILGGTVFTFGLILAVALLGIGLGGACYASFGKSRRATLLGFAATCLFEALLMAVPYALGDHIAVWTLLLRSFGVFGFSGLLFGWTIITLIVVLPAAFVAGIQFPLLIALLGRRSRARRKANRARVRVQHRRRHRGVSVGRIRFAPGVDRARLLASGGVGARGARARGGVSRISGPLGSSGNAVSCSRSGGVGRHLLAPCVPPDRPRCGDTVPSASGASRQSRRARRRRCAGG